MRTTDDIDVKNREAAATPVLVSAMTVVRVTAGPADATARERQQQITVD